jgi:hypothetical protein
MANVPEKAARLLGGCALALVLAACGRRPSELPLPHVFIYQYPPAHGYAYCFSGSAADLVPLDGTPAPLRAGPPAMDRTPLNDCSNDTLRCLSSRNFVLAVPRGELEPARSYHVADARIDVLGCIPESDEKCAVAILQSICLVHPTGAEADDRNRTVCRDYYATSRMIYVFDRKRGILAFDEASGWPEHPDLRGWKLDTLGTTAPMYALVGTRGLFARRD